MPLNNPMRQLYCPYCSKPFYAGECKIVSGHDNTLREAQTGLLAHIWSSFLNEPNITKHLAIRACPHCDHILPSHFEQAENLTIAIIGDGASGVSSYIAALLHELREGIVPKMYSNILVSALKGHATYHYFVPLFLNKQKLPLTHPSVSPEPLIYEFIRQAPSEQWLQRINLIFYDTAHEDTIDDARIAQYAPYIFHVSGIIYLVDPLSIPGIVNHLPEHLEHHILTRPLYPSEVLNRVLLRLHQDNGQKISVPLAITLSKADLLQHLKGPNEKPYTFLSNPERSSPFDPNDLYLINTEVQTVIEQFGEQSLLRSANFCEHAAFFAVSATGHSANEDGHYPDVTPIRCLDPLLWILWKLGVLEAKTTAGNF